MASEQSKQTARDFADLLDRQAEALRKTAIQLRTSPLIDTPQGDTFLDFSIFTMAEAMNSEWNSMYIKALNTHTPEQVEMYRKMQSELSK